MIDVSQFDTLAADLSEGGRLAGVKALAVVEASSKRIEDQARELAPTKRLPHYANTITHDVTVEDGAVVGEIGPDREINGQARLAHIFEYGTATLAPHAHVGPALDRETPAFEKAVSDLGGILR